MNIPASISLSINLDKIDEQYVIKGKNGARYLDLRLVNTPNNEYGSDYMATQSLPKSVRDEVKASGGEWPKTPILGNGNAWQCMEGTLNANKPSRGEEKPSVEAPASTSETGTDLPF